MTESITQSALVGVFDDREAAEMAMLDLTSAGFSQDQVGFVLRGADVVEGGMITDAEGAKDIEGGVHGAAIGAMVGAGLAAVVSLLLPGVGPVLAAGVLATAIGYGAAGAAVGVIFGALQGLGVSEHEAIKYEQLFHAGKAIVAVDAGLRSEDAEVILRRHGGFDIHQEAQNPVSISGPGDF